MALNNTYIDFIRYAIHQDMPVPEGADKIDWADYLDFCYRQGVVGLVFDGLERSELRIPQMTLLEWIGAAESIKQQNKVLNKRTVQIFKFFQDKGLRCAVLKGQANGVMYPNPELRSPGDIDIWVDSDRRELINLVRNVTPDSHFDVYHIKFPLYQDVMVEVHYVPSWMIDKRKNRKLQLYINRIKEEQFNNKITLDRHVIASLTNGFNLVYQMLHMYGHFFESRNNLKQLIDYYYLLKQDIKETDRLAAKRIIEELELTKYTSGVMWILREILGADEQRLIVEPNERIGKAVWEGVEEYGDFSDNKLFRVIEQIVGNFKVFRLFPTTVLYSPIHFLWHQLWKVKMSFSL